MIAAESPRERAEPAGDRGLALRVVKASAAASGVAAPAFGLWQVRSVLTLFLLA